MLESEEELLFIFADGFTIFSTRQITNGLHSRCTTTTITGSATLAFAITRSQRFVDTVDFLRIVPVGKRILLVSVVVSILINSVAVGIKLVRILIAFFLTIWVMNIEPESITVIETMVVLIVICQLTFFVYTEGKA